MTQRVRQSLGPNAGAACAAVGALRSGFGMATLAHMFTEGGRDLAAYDATGSIMVSEGAALWYAGTFLIVHESIISCACVCVWGGGAPARHIWGHTCLIHACAGYSDRAQAQADCTGIRWGALRLHRLVIVLVFVDAGA